MLIFLDIDATNKLTSPFFFVHLWQMNVEELQKMAGARTGGKGSVRR